MKGGDLVRWIGFPGACKEGVKATSPGSEVGIVIRIENASRWYTERVDVLWGNGRIGRGLYTETVAVV